MKRIISRKTLKKGILLTACLVPFISAKAADEYLIVDQGFVFSFKLAVALTFLAFVATVFLAIASSVRNFKFLSLTYRTNTESGRDVTAGARELWMIVFFGLSLAMIVFAFRYNPFISMEQMIALKQKATPVAVVEEVEDWTEIADDKLVFMTEASDIDAGGVVFKKSCAICHGEKGEGGAGPNLADQYWLHGGSAKAIYATITDGVPATSMVGWKEKITPIKRLQLASFIKTFQGTNPENGKKPEGELYEEENAAEENPTAEQDTSAGNSPK